MKRTITFVLLIISISAFSQQVSPEIISSAGDHFENDDISLSWTLGEPVISTLSGEYILTQGFHQDLYIITAIDEVELSEFDVKIFPNPTPDFLNIQMNQTGDVKSEYVIQLLDSKGSLLQEIKENGGMTVSKISLQQFERAHYFLRIIVGKKHKTYKIIKT